MTSIAFMHFGGFVALEIKINEFIKATPSILLFYTVGYSFTISCQ